MGNLYHKFSDEMKYDPKILRSANKNYIFYTQHYSLYDCLHSEYYKNQ